jgi:hypothetical protein
MMRPENFIYFLTSNGFFLGLMYAVLVDLDPFMILYSAAMLSIIFYIIGLASSSFFIRYIDMKSNYDIHRKNKEEVLDKIVLRLEKKERFIRDSHEFIVNLEKEFQDLEDQSKEKSARAK